MTGVRRLRQGMVAVLLAGSFVQASPAPVAGAEPPEAESAPPEAAGRIRGPGGPPPPFEAMLERHAERLGLEPAARSEIRSIAIAARDEARGLERRVRELHDELRTLLDQEKPDLEATLGQAERIGSAETDLHKLRLRTMLRIRDLLTPEQRRELVRIHEERRSKRHHGREPDGW